MSLTLIDNSDSRVTTQSIIVIFLDDLYSDAIVAAQSIIVIFLDDLCLVGNETLFFFRHLQETFVCLDSIVFLNIYSANNV